MAPKQKLIDLLTREIKKWQKPGTSLDGDQVNKLRLWFRFIQGETHPGTTRTDVSPRTSGQKGKVLNDIRTIENISRDLSLLVCIVVVPNDLGRYPDKDLTTAVQRWWEATAHPQPLTDSAAAVCDANGLSLDKLNDLARTLKNRRRAAVLHEQRQDASKKAKQAEPSGGAAPGGRRRPRPQSVSPDPEEEPRTPRCRQRGPSFPELARPDSPEEEEEEEPSSEPPTSSPLQGSALLGSSSRVNPFSSYGSYGYESHGYGSRPSGQADPPLGEEYWSQVSARPNPPAFPPSTYAHLPAFPPSIYTHPPPATGTYTNPPYGYRNPHTFTAIPIPPSAYDPSLPPPPNISEGYIPSGQADTPSPISYTEQISRLRDTQGPFTGGRAPRRLADNELSFTSAEVFGTFLRIDEHSIGPSIVMRPPPDGSQEEGVLTLDFEDGGSGTLRLTPQLSRRVIEEIERIRRNR